MGSMGVGLGVPAGGGMGVPAGSGVPLMGQSGIQGMPPGMRQPTNTGLAP